tara:strand:- start:888 stop:1112 length:225 start_codon:yes stop_codon:yes gene_type:complete
MSGCGNCNCEPTKRVFLDLTINGARSSGYYVRSDLHDRIRRIEEQTGSKVVGVVYEDSYTIELILDPPLGGEEE